MTASIARRVPSGRIPLTPARIEAAIRDHVAAVATAKAAGANRIPADATLRDAEVVGLSVRIRSSGAATFVVGYRVGGRLGKARRYVIGPVEKVKLTEARKRAVAVVAAVQHGRDVAAEERAQAKAVAAEAQAEAGRLTLEGLLALYSADMARRGVKDRKADESLLRRVLVPAFGAEAGPASLTRAKLVAVLNDIRDAGEPGKAKKASARLHSLFSFACDQGLVEQHPLAGRRHVQTKAQRHAAAAESAGRALSMDEVGMLWNACGDERLDTVVRAYVKMLLVTGCRRTEMAQAQLDWLQRETPIAMPVLVLPREATKNGHEHAVPLPQLAVDVIDSVKRLQSTRWLWPARRGRGPLSGWTHRWATVMALAKEHGLKGDLTMHDLRRSARSHWTRLGVDAAVAELMLNHRPKDQLLAIYDLEQRMLERASAMQAWCDSITRAAATAEPGAVSRREVPAGAGSRAA